LLLQALYLSFKKRHLLSLGDNEIIQVFYGLVLNLDLSFDQVSKGYVSHTFKNLVDIHIYLLIMSANQLLSVRITVTQNVLLVNHLEKIHDLFN